MAPAVGQPLGFDPENDLKPITLGFLVPLVLLVNPALGAGNVQELIAMAKSRPGQLNYSVTGHAGTNHVAGEMFRHSADIAVLHVPYKGDAEALVAVLGEEFSSRSGFPQAACRRFGQASSNHYWLLPNAVCQRCRTFLPVPRQGYRTWRSTHGPGSSSLAPRPQR